MSNEVIKASYKEIAKTVDRKPSFGIDIPPVGIDKINKNKIPTSAKGTFYDLFSPEVNKKEEAEKVKQEKLAQGSDDSSDEPSKRTRFAAGNPKNYYTFKALFKTYFVKLLDEVFSGSSIKREPITESMLNNYFFRQAKTLADHTIVKRNGLNFEVTLPLYIFKLEDFAKQIKEDLESSGLTETKDQTIKFLQNFWTKNYKTFPINVVNGKVEELIDKTKVSLSIDPSYTKASDFYKKYMRHYKITSITKIKSDVSYSSDKLALPSPSGYVSSTGVKSLRVVSDEPDMTDFNNRQVGTELFSTEFLISAVVNLPFEEAKFYVQSEHPKEFELLDFIHSWYSQAMGTLGSSAYPTYKHSMVAVREKNKGYAEFSQPVTNGDKLALTKNNRLIYLPDLEMIDQYRESMINATYDSVSDSYSFKHKPSYLPKYSLIYVDWINRRAAYTDSNAKLHSINLSVVYDVKATNYVKHLNTIFDSGVAKYLGFIFSKAASLNLYYPLNSRQDIDKAYDLVSKYDLYAAQDALVDVADLIKSGQLELAMMNFYVKFFTTFSERIEAGEQDLMPSVTWPIKLKDVLQAPEFAPLSLRLHSLFTSVFAKAENIINYINLCKRDVPTSLEELAFLLPMKYIKNYSNVINAAVTELQPYREQDHINLDDPIKLKNFTGVEVLMRHQGKALKKLNKKPLVAVIGVAAGGGKTLITIADIIDNLVDKTVTKPLVLCPNGLIKDYVNEINFAGQGKLNAVAFDTTVFNNYANVGMDDDGNITWDYTRLKALVDHSPINTVFILGYDVIASSTSNKIMNVYGNEVYETFSHLEFLASCAFDGVWCDESHYLKGSDSLRVMVNEILIAPIKFKRLLTGTIVPNTLVDLVKQMMLLNPSILGTERAFRKQFSSDGAETGTFIPGKSAITEIMSLIKQECTFVNVQRKEWAAILPELHEFTVKAFLTEGQKKAYKYLINLQVDILEKGAGKLSKEELEALNDNSTSEEADEVVERIFDNAVGNLAAVEAFLANPTSIDKTLQEQFFNSQDDYKSPKGRVIVDEILKHHLSHPEQYPGKILIFCNTHAAVAGIWNSLPPEIKALTIYYSSAKKADYERQFKTDDTKKILIGVSDSLDTGLNLQAADTIIRVDTVWTPGKLEQGNARINRPNLKDKDAEGNRYDFRKENGINVYYVVIDGTIDVIKMAKLTSKTVTLAKFYNADGPDAKRYESLGLDDSGKPIEPLRVSFDLLRQGLRFEELQPYLNAYEGLRQVEHDIYLEYANKNPEELKPFVVSHTGIIEGSKVLRNVPYVAGAGIFNSDQLGLVPYLQYKQKEISDKGEENWEPEGLLIHTEFGDGTVIKETGSTVHLRMNETLIRLPISPSVIFVVTKKLTSTMEIRDQLVKTTGLDSVDVQLDTHRNQQRQEKKSVREEKERLAEEKRKARELRRQAREQEAEDRKTRKYSKINPVTVVEDDDTQEDDEYDDEIDSTIELKYTPFNEMLGLTIISDDPHSEIGMFKKYGFVVTKPYLAAEVKRKDSLAALLDKMNTLQAKGTIDMSQDIWDMWNHLEHEFAQGRSKLLQVSNTPKTKITHFLRTNYRKVKVPQSIRALPMIIDGKLFMVIDLASHHASTVNKIRRLIVSGVTWEVKDSEMLGLYTNKSQLSSAIKSMENDGWSIANKKDIATYYQRTKVKSK
jgi:hypothetical protein